MKKIIVILSLVLCACDSNDDAKKSWDKMVDNLATQEYQDCLNYATKEFKNTDPENEKTCKCVIDYLYRTEPESKDRFATDLRAILQDKCGNNIPSYTLRDIPEK
ncbi:MAG: hypothetical protein J6W79_02295 [Alphaproteobacteria bacterium]|nr:hypothetical protein [Alphaproteobacteria bacterium]